MQYSLIHLNIPVLTFRITTFDSKDMQIRNHQEEMKRKKWKTNRHDEIYPYVKHICFNTNIMGSVNELKIKLII
jgi:uncharacterized protein YjlB